MSATEYMLTREGDRMAMEQAGSELAGAPSVEIDCRGLFCPLPILRTREALTDMEVGEVVKVIATDPAAEIDMAAFSATSGHAIVAQYRHGDELVFFLRRA